MIASLTSFRAITAFVVFLFHCQGHLGWKLNIKILDQFFNNGAVFMTGFFVLSGFIMAYVYGNTDFTKRENILNFYLKRFAKIYPTYAVATIVYFSIFHDFSLQQYLKIFVNDLLLIQGFFPSDFLIGINSGTWSLTVEMFLYLLFPFIIFFFGKTTKTLVIGAIFAAIISFNINLDQSNIMYSNPIFRVADFFCGVGFYFFCQKIPFKFCDSTNGENCVFSILGNAWCYFCGMSKKILVKFDRSVHVLIISMLFLVSTFFGSDKYQYLRGQFIIAPLFGLWITLVYYSKSRCYNNKSFEYLGFISYSFYLWQFVAIKSGKQLIVSYPNINLHLVVLMVFLINLGVAALSYHFLEKRARKFILKKFARKSHF